MEHRAAVPDSEKERNVLVVLLCSFSRQSPFIFISINFEYMTITLPHLIDRGDPLIAQSLTRVCSRDINIQISAGSVIAEKTLLAGQSV